MALGVFVLTIVTWIEYHKAQISHTYYRGVVRWVERCKFFLQVGPKSRLSPDSNEGYICVYRTVFQTHQGQFGFRVMPFRFTNDPATFQELVNSILAGWHPHLQNGLANTLGAFSHSVWYPENSTVIFETVQVCIWTAINTIFASSNHSRWSGDGYWQNSAIVNWAISKDNLGTQTIFGSDRLLPPLS